VTVRPALALLFLAACTPHPPAVADTGNAADGSGVDAGSSLPESAPPSTPPSATPDASTIDLAADGGLAALLSGAVPAARLPEVATEPGQQLDRLLRERLTTREGTDPDSPAAAGAETNVVVTVNGVSASSPVNDAERVVASLRPRARACYRTGMTSDPKMAGKLVVEARIGASGDVGDTRVVQNLGLSPQVAGCVARGYKNATFDPPAGGAGSTLTVTLTFATSR
jgi:hypothetical protein